MNNKIDDLEDPFLPPPPPEIEVKDVNMDLYHIDYLPKISEHEEKEGNLNFFGVVTMNITLNIHLNEEAKKLGITKDDIRKSLICKSNGFTSGLNFYFNLEKRKIFLVERFNKSNSYTDVATFDVLEETNGNIPWYVDIDWTSDDQIGPYAEVQGLIK